MKNSPLRIQLVKCAIYANETRTESLVIIIIVVSRYGSLFNVKVNIIKVHYYLIGLMLYFISNMDMTALNTG